MVPVKKLELRKTSFIFTSFANSVGMVPVKDERYNTRSSRRTKLPNTVGMVPLGSMLLDKSSDVNFVQRASSVGMVPVLKAWNIESSFKYPISLGILPLESVP